MTFHYLFALFIVALTFEFLSTGSYMKIKEHCWYGKQTDTFSITQRNRNQIPPIKGDEGWCKKPCEETKILRGNTLYHYLRSLFLSGILLLLLLIGCGSDRVNIEFQSSRDIYIDDTKTDPDKLNRELDYDLKETEKRRLEKQRAVEAEAKAKAEAKRKA